jgi:hypothetical protein
LSIPFCTVRPEPMMVKGLVFGTEKFTSVVSPSSWQLKVWQRWADFIRSTWNGLATSTEGRKDWTIWWRPGTLVSSMYGVELVDTTSKVNWKSVRWRQKQQYEFRVDNSSFMNYQYCCEIRCCGVGQSVFTKSKMVDDSTMNDQFQFHWSHEYQFTQLVNLEVSIQNQTLVRPATWITLNFLLIRWTKVRSGQTKKIIKLDNNFQN